MTVRSKTKGALTLKNIKKTFQRRLRSASLLLQCACSCEIVWFHAASCLIQNWLDPELCTVSLKWLQPSTQLRAASLSHVSSSNHSPSIMKCSVNTTAKRALWMFESMLVDCSSWSQHSDHSREVWTLWTLFWIELYELEMKYSSKGENVVLGE